MKSQYSQTAISRVGFPSYQWRKERHHIPWTILAKRLASIPRRKCWWTGFLEGDTVSLSCIWGWQVVHLSHTHLAKNVHCAPCWTRVGESRNELLFNCPRLLLLCRVSRLVLVFLYLFYVWQFPRSVSYCLFTSFIIFTTYGYMAGEQTHTAIHFSIPRVEIPALTTFFWRI